MWLLGERLSIVRRTGGENSGVNGACSHLGRREKRAREVRFPKWRELLFHAFLIICRFAHGVVQSIIKKSKDQVSEKIRYKICGSMFIRFGFSFYCKMYTFA